MEKLSTQVVGFVVSMVLARLLTPDDYGTVALTAIFFAVANVLVDGGFGNALIQKKESDDLDFNSVFYLNVALSLIVYMALFVTAPWIAVFYKASELTLVIRVSGISLLFNAVSAIQNAELTKKMLFHLSFRVSLIASLVSAICGVTLAILGYGVWALVYSSLMTSFVGVIARWFIVAWRPKMMFSLSRLQPLFSYGWKIAVSSLLDQFFVHINGLLIGRFYSKADLAYVNRGNTLPQLAMGQVDETLGRVAFPALVLMQDDKSKVRNTMRRMIQCSTFFVFPLMVGIAICSRSILRLLYGAQWEPAAPYMMLACFSFALWPFHTINLKGIMAEGRSDLFLKLEMIKKGLKLIAILLAFRHGIFVFMAVTAFALGPLSVLVNAWPNRKLLGYTIWMQLQDVVPTALICGAEAVVVIGGGLVSEFLKPLIGISDQGVSLMLFLAFKLLFQIMLGVVSFLCLAHAFRIKAMYEYVLIVSQLMQARFPRISIALERICVR